MFPELGKYATAVLGSYGLTIFLLGSLIAWTIYQHIKTKRALTEAEKRLEQKNV